MFLSDKLIAISEGVRSYLLRVEGVPPQKVAVVRNGIQVDQFDPSVDDIESTHQRLGIPDDALVIGTVAAFNSSKGLVHLVQAARRVVSQVPQSYFLLVGGGPQEAELNQLVVNLGLEGKVLLCGHANHAEVISLVRAMDVFVLPSLIEGLGLAILEAQALEKPCVVTSIPGLSEAVAPGQTAIVVPPGEEYPLANAIISLLADKQKRLAMGKAGRHFVQEHYAASRMASKYDEVYDEILRAKRSSTHGEVE
jgi:glycosyltransferase involved in cell wall biosynthesis